MSKSLGNILSIKQMLKKSSADALRLFILSGHYRMPLKYSEEAVEAAERGGERLRQAAFAAPKEGSKPGDTNPDLYRERFIEALEDDFNTPQGIAALFDLTREINRQIDAGLDPAASQQVLLEACRVARPNASRRGKKR